MPQCMNSVIVGADIFPVGAAGLAMWIALQILRTFFLILGKAAPLHEPHSPHAHISCYNFLGRSKRWMILILQPDAAHG